MPTLNYNFPTINRNNTADVPRDLNALAEAVDTALKVVDEKAASAKTNLNDTVTSTSKTEAATANAVKTAYDKATAARERAEQAFTQAADGKGLIAAAATDMGVPTSATDDFATMATNIRAINTGKRFASGNGGVQTSSFSVNDLPFAPSVVIIKKGNAAEKEIPYEFQFAYKDWGIGSLRSHWASNQYIEVAVNRTSFTQNGFSVSFWNAFSGVVEWIAIE